MVLRRLILIAMLVALMVIHLVYERSRITRAGYEISRLARDETKLVEQVRILDVQVNRLRQPEFIQRQVERLRIDLMRSPQGEVLAVSSEIEP